MNPSPTLLDSQRWLLTVMTASQGAEAGLALAAQAQGLTLEDMIMPPPRGDARAGGGVRRGLSGPAAGLPAGGFSAAGAGDGGRGV